MQLQDAVQLVQGKFAAEMQEQSEGEAIDKYHEAFEKFPVLMEVATYAFADGIVQQNYEMRRAMAAKQQGQAASGNGAPGGDRLPPTAGN
jgi:hypothetical protein